MTTHRIDLPLYAELPINLTTQTQRPDRITTLRDLVAHLASEQLVPIPDRPVTMRLHWEPTGTAVRDSIPARCTSTVCAEALRDTGLTVTAEPPQIRPLAERTTLWLEITIPDDEETATP
jgi:hypothetical protein